MKTLLQSLSSLLFGVLFLLAGPTILLVLWIPVIFLTGAACNWFVLPILFLPIGALAGVVFAVRAVQRAQRR